MRATPLLAFALLFSVRATAAEPVVTLPISEVVSGPAKPVAMAPDGSWVAFVGTGGIGDPDRPLDTGRVQVWNLKTGTLDRSFPTPGIWRDEIPVAVSPDGRWLAYTVHLDYKPQIRLHDFRTGKLARTIPVTDVEVVKKRDGVSASAVIGFSADGKEMYTSAFPGSGGTKVVVWSTAEGKRLRDVTVTQYERVTVSPDGKTALVAPSRNGDHQELWDLTTGKRTADLGRDSVYGKPTFLRGGKELALLFDHQYSPHFRVWEVGTPKESSTVKMSAKSKDPIGFALTDDRSATAILEYYGTLRVFDAGKTEPRFTFATKANRGEGPLFTPDGKRVIVVDRYERVWVLDANTGKPVFTLGADYRSVKGLAFTADGKTLVAGVAHWPHPKHGGTVHPPDGFLLTWDVRTGELKSAATGVDNFLDAVFPSASGEKAMLTTGEYSRQAEWWDVKAGKRLKVIADKDAGVSSYGGSADGTKFGGVRHEYKEVDGGGRAGYAKDVRIWDATTGKVLIELDKANSDYAVRFTPDGKFALLRDSAVGVRSYSTATGKSVTLWKGTGEGYDKHPQEPVPLPDGESFVAYHKPQQFEKRDLYLYDIGRVVKFGTTDVHTGPVALSPDGKWAAAGGRERDKPNPVYLWKLPELGPLDEKKLAAGKIAVSDSLAKRITLDGHLGEVFAVAFSPGGRTLATGGRDKIIRLWDVRTGTLKASLWYAPPTDPAAAPSDWAAFTPTGFHDGTTRGRAFLRFTEGDEAKLHNAEKVGEAIKGK